MTRSGDPDTLVSGYAAEKRDTIVGDRPTGCDFMRFDSDVPCRGIDHGPPVAVASVVESHPYDPDLPTWPTVRDFLDVEAVGGVGPVAPLSGAKRRHADCIPLSNR